MIMDMETLDLPPATLLASCKQIATDVAIQAGGILQSYAEQGFRIEYKDAVNLVTDADKRSEEVIISTLRSQFPDHQILAEEAGLTTTSSSPFKWIIDPLDGTTNFSHRFPAYCVSIGLEFKGQPILGVIFDPTREELFVAESGGGAFLNDQPIHVSKAQQLNSALLVTGFAYDIRETSNNNLDMFTRMSLKAQGVRRTGTAALDLCYVASGRFDGFWEMKLNPWDTAAGIVIVQEAGGQVTDYAGKPYSVYGKEIVASNGTIHQAMLTELQSRTR